MNDVRAILTYEKSIRRDVESAILDYYQSTVYFDTATGVDGKPLPKPTQLLELHQLVTEPAIHVCDRTESEGVLEFDLHFGCIWDEEHGLTVRIQNWSVAKIA